MRLLLLAFVLLSGCTESRPEPVRPPAPFRTIGRAPALPGCYSCVDGSWVQDPDTRLCFYYSGNNRGDVLTVVPCTSLPGQPR